MNLQARLTLSFVLLAVLLAATISSVDLAGEINQQFAATLERAEKLRTLAADQVGLAQRKAAGDLAVRIGGLARKLGRPALARRYYQRFVAEFPRDGRTYLIRERLRALPPGRALPQGGA